MTRKTSNFGHFITFTLWEQAIDLLDFQVECQESNKHFKTISMIYYRKLGTSVEKLRSEKYFKEKVASNFFYGLENEFAIYPYVIPKSGLGLRNYKFLTYPMRALYYAVGLYLLKLSEEFLDNFVKSRPRVRSFYGGKLRFEGDELKVTKNTIYFLQFYKKFRNRIRTEISGDVHNKLVIRLDVENYYDEIRVPRLLELLHEYTKSSQQASLHFDQTTRDQIAFFFRFLANSGYGIPQSDNCIVSSFIGYLYLVFGDLLIEEELRRDRKLVKDYLLTRYVDDVFLSVTFKDGVADQSAYAESFGARIADIFYHELGLNLNPKTRFFCLNDEQQMGDLRSSLKKVSPEYHLASESDDEPPARKIESIFDELEQIKEASVEPETFGHELRDEILKEVYDQRVRQMLDMNENKDRIRDTFGAFDFNRVKWFPLPMMLIILKDQSTAERFRTFLVNNKRLTTRDVDLMLRYLCQVGFEDSEMLSRLEEYEPMKAVIKVFKQSTLSVDQPGYYKLNGAVSQQLSQMPYVIEQIRHRAFNERLESYSVALNHLLNEVHAICWELDGSSERQDRYDANDVVEFLDSQSVPLEVCIGIRNLFDRRNTNQVSHPGSEQYATWSVRKEEYCDFRSQVGKCMGSLL